MHRALRVALAVAASAAATGSVEAQFHAHAHAAYTSYQDGGFGGGARLGLGIPILPIDVVGVAEIFSPECSGENQGCSLWGASLDANVKLPFPIVRPYVTGGLTYREGKPTDTAEASSSSGFNLGLGLDLHFLFRVFADYRYEFLSSELDGSVVRAGILFNL